MSIRPTLCFIMQNALLLDWWPGDARTRCNNVMRELTALPRPTSWIINVKNVTAVITGYSVQNAESLREHYTNERRVRKWDKQVRRDVI